MHYFGFLFLWVFFSTLPKFIPTSKQMTDVFFAIFPIARDVKNKLKQCWHLDGYIRPNLRKYAPGSSSPTERGRSTEGTEPLQTAAEICVQHMEGGCSIGWRESQVRKGPRPRWQMFWAELPCNLQTLGKKVGYTYLKCFICAMQNRIGGKSVVRLFTFQ